MSSDDEGSDDNDKTYKIKDDEIEKNVRRSKRKRATNEKQKPQIRQTRSRTSRFVTNKTFICFPLID